MSHANDPLAPPSDAFEEPWQAQAMALADTLVRSGQITAAEWATALGAALDARKDQPDTLTTYYTAVLDALETVTEPTIPAATRASRRKAWEDAFARTPHGQPVTLDAAKVDPN